MAGEIYLVGGKLSKMIQVILDRGVRSLGINTALRNDAAYKNNWDWCYKL
jgi:hypothetical protein